MITISEKVKRYFDPIFEAPLSTWENFVSLGQVRSFEKKEVLKAPNTTEKFLHFIVEGSGGILLWHNNNFVCIDLAFENELFCDYMSFTTQQPSPLEVVAFAKTTTLSIPRLKFLAVFEKGAHGERITRMAAEQAFIEKQQQQIDLLTKTASERFEDLCNQHGSYLNLVPDKYIASYLGITPQSLSRIKKSRNS